MQEMKGPIYKSLIISKQLFLKAKSKGNIHPTIFQRLVSLTEEFNDLKGIKIQFFLFLVFDFFSLCFSLFNLCFFDWTQQWHW